MKRDCHAPGFCRQKSKHSGSGATERNQRPCCFTIALFEMSVHLCTASFRSRRMSSDPKSQSHGTYLLMIKSQCPQIESKYLLKELNAPLIPMAFGQNGQTLNRSWRHRNDEGANVPERKASLEGRSCNVTERTEAAVHRHGRKLIGSPVCGEMAPFRLSCLDIYGNKCGCLSQ